MHSENIRKRGHNCNRSFRFPLRAGGTERARGLAPLAKRGENLQELVRAQRLGSEIRFCRGTFSRRAVWNPPSPRPSPPLIRGERAGSGGILPAKTHPLVRRMNVAGVPLSYQSLSQSSKKQQLMTPSLRFPLHAGGTE
jgi:hypothetical protein